MGDKKEEVLSKIDTYVQTRFGGNFRKAFDHYDQLTGQNGTVTKEGVMQLLADANVDTRVFGFSAAGKYADQLIEAIDLNKDGAVDWPEFEAKLKAG